MTTQIVRRASIATALAVAALCLAAPAQARPNPLTNGKVHQSLPGARALVHLMKGGVLYNHPPSFPPPDHDQTGVRKIPLGPYHARAISPQATFALGGTPGGIRRELTVQPRSSLSIQTDTGLAVSSCAPNGCWPPEPNEASDGNVVVYTTNTYIGFSVNGGASFKSFTPGSLFPDDPNGGPCCDQILQYAPQINRFIWILQYNPGKGGNDRYRVTVFPPSSVTAAGLTGTFGYWDIISNYSFPGLPYHWFDFPDLALGKRYLYVDFDMGVAATGKVYGSVIARIGLTNLQKGLNLAAAPEPWEFISGSLFFGRVAQNTGSVAYWAAPVNTSQMNISDWPESGSLWYGPYLVNIASWPNSGYASKTPDGDSWNSTYTGAVLTAAVANTANSRGKDLWLAWPGGRGTGPLAWLTQPHVELAAISLPSLTFVSQTAIWNASYALSFPNLAVDTAGDLGIELAFGGGKSWVNSAASNFSKGGTDFWAFTSSNTSDGHNRWGDYIDIRPAYGDKGGQFTAAGFGTNTSGSTKIYDPYFVAFSVS